MPNTVNDSGTDILFCAEAVPSKPTPTGPRVYFIRRGDAIKIGFSEHVDRRLAGLQSGHHEPLVLLGSIPADAETEYSAHTRFAHLRIRGEWFKAAPELLAFIESPEVLPVVPDVIPDSYERAADDYMLWHKRQMKVRASMSCAESTASTLVAFWMNMLKNGQTPERLAGLSWAMAKYESVKSV